MNFQELIQYLAYAVITVSIPILTKYITNWLRAKTNETEYSDIAEIVISAVEETNQTYVDELKEAGNFTEEAQSIALNKSLTKAISLLSDDFKKLIHASSDSIEVYLTTLIESYIKSKKE